MRLSHVLLAAALEGAIYFCGDQPPAAPAAPAPAIVTLNPDRVNKDGGGIVPAAAPAAPTVYKLAAGKTRVFKLDGYTKPVTWIVDQPINSDGTAAGIVRGKTTRKGGDIFCVMEGNTLADVYTFDVDVFCVVSTGAGSGFVKISALAVEGTDIKILAQLVVEVGGRPNPPLPNPPGPNPPADGVLGLAKASRDGAAQVACPTKDADAKSLAQKNRSFASAISAGGVVDAAGKFTAEAALLQWRDVNNKAVKQPADWAPWGRSVSARLATLHAAGKLPDKAAWAAAFAEIADGLEN